MVAVPCGLACVLATVVRVCHCVGSSGRARVTAVLSDGVLVFPPSRPVCLQGGSGFQQQLCRFISIGAYVIFVSEFLIGSPLQGCLVGLSCFVLGAWQVLWASFSLLHGGITRRDPLESSRVFAAVGARMCDSVSMQKGLRVGY